MGTCNGHCNGHHKAAVKVKALKEDQSGKGAIKIQGHLVTYVKKGNIIEVTFSSESSGHKITGVAKRDERDKFRLKLGVEMALARVLEEYIAQQRAAFEENLKSVIRQHDSLVEEIMVAQPDTKLKRIVPRRHKAATVVTE